MPQQDSQIAQKGRMVALVIAGTGALWVLFTMIGAQLGLSQRVRAFFDLMALGGFIYALVLIYQLWHMRRGKQG